MYQLQVNAERLEMNLIKVIVLALIWTLPSKVSRRLVPVNTESLPMKLAKVFFVVAFLAISSQGFAQFTPNQLETMRQHGLDCNLRYDGCGSGSSS